MYYPYGCTEWTIRENIDILNDSIDKLSQTYDVRICRDYHGHGNYEHMKLFTYIINIDTFLQLLHRFNEQVITFKDETNNDNILHMVMKNPNIDCANILLDIIPDSYLYELSNQYNSYHQKPIELVTDVNIFKRLLSYTNIDKKILKHCINNSSTILELVYTYFNEYISNTDITD